MPMTVFPSFNFQQWTLVACVEWGAHTNHAKQRELKPTLEILARTNGYVVDIKNKQINVLIFGLNMGIKKNNKISLNSQLNV